MADGDERNNLDRIRVLDGSGRLVLRAMVPTGAPTPELPPPARHGLAHAGWRVERDERCAYSEHVDNPWLADPGLMPGDPPQET